MKFGSKKPEKIPMYVYYIIARYRYHSSEYACSSGSAGKKYTEDRLFYIYRECGEG